MDFNQFNHYNHWANLLVHSTIQEHPHHEDANKMFHHILEASELWYSRLKENQPTWNDSFRIEEFGMRIDKIFQSYQSYIQEVVDYEWNQNITYKTLKGEEFSSTRDLILTHVFHHASHHRAQILILWNQKGIPRPPLDLIFYDRQASR